MRLQLSSGSVKGSRSSAGDTLGRPFWRFARSGVWWLVILLVAGKTAKAQRLTTRAEGEVTGYVDSMQVMVTSPSVKVSVGDDVAGWSVGGRYLVDVVSAASVDIVATASPRWNELRHVGSIEGMYKRGVLTVGAAANVSHEPDYLSLGAALNVAVDLLEKNLTPFFAVRYGHDDVGRRGLGREHWSVLQRGGAQAGVTFVINRSLIASVQLDADFERGYLAKPYRYIPLFAEGSSEQVAVGASPQIVNALRLDERPVDSVPDARDRYALTGRIAGRVRRTTLRLDERLYRDSWGLWASTTDARVFVDVGARWLLQPHLRLHTQSSVLFWQRAYEVTSTKEGGRVVPRYRTGDRELSRLDTLTMGFTSKLRLNPQAQSPWFLQVQIDGAYTRFLDALYLTNRVSLFTALGVSAQWN